MSILLAFVVQVAAQHETPKIKLDQSHLNAMSDACHTPRKWLKHLGGEEVQFQPPPDAKFDQIECLLKRLRANLVPMKLGFIGNEQIPEEN